MRGFLSSINKPSCLKRRVFWGTILAVWVLVVFFPVVSFELLNWDDNVHVYENPLVSALSWDNITKIFHSEVNKTYIPLSLLTYALEHHFVGFSPFWYHLNNLIGHVGVTLLVFHLALRWGLSRGAAFWGALLFGIHPMHVESVAWVTGRKDILYSLFYLAALDRYLVYLSTENSRQRAWAYGMALAAAFLSILAKPMALSLPFILGLCLWEKKKGIGRRELAALLPFAFVVWPVAWQTYILNARVPPVFQGESFLVWIWTAMFYPLKFFFPFEFSVLYAIPQPVTLSHPAYMSAVIALVCWLCLNVMMGRQSLWRWAWGFYILSTFFLWRFDDRVDITVVADRFMYLPSLGFCWLIGWGLDHLWDQARSPRAKGLAVVLAIGLMMGLSVKTRKTLAPWRNSLTLWNSVVAEHPNMPMVFINRGNVYFDLGQLDKAVADYDEALRLKDDLAKGLYNRALAWLKQGETEKAFHDIEEALVYTPRDDALYVLRGQIYQQRGEDEKAAADFDTALSLNPHNKDALAGRAGLWGQLGDHRRVVEVLSVQIEKGPDPLAYLNRGVAYQLLKEEDKAERDYDQALSLKPKWIPALMAKANLLLDRGQTEEAIRFYTQVIQQDASFQDAYYNRGVAWIQKEAWDNAWADYSKIVELEPNHIKARFQRAEILRHQGRWPDAVEEYNAILKISPHNRMAYLQRSLAEFEGGQMKAALQDATKARFLGEALPDGYWERLQTLQNP